MAAPNVARAEIDRRVPWRRRPLDPRMTPPQRRLAIGEWIVRLICNLEFSRDEARRIAWLTYLWETNRLEPEHPARRGL